MLGEATINITDVSNDKKELEVDLQKYIIIAQHYSNSDYDYYYYDYYYYLNMLLIFCNYRGHGAVRIVIRLTNQKKDEPILKAGNLDKV